MSSSSAALPSATAAREIVDAGRWSIELGGQRRRARFELGRGLLEPLTSAASAARARPAPRARRRPRPRAGSSPARALARLEQAALRGGQPLVGRALFAVERGDRRARFLLTASSASRSSSACRRSRASCSAFCSSRVSSSAERAAAAPRADDGLLLAVVLGVERGDGVRRLGDRALRTRPFRQRGGRAPRARRRCARADP